MDKGVTFIDNDQMFKMKEDMTDSNHNRGNFIVQVRVLMMRTQMVMG